jgi:hypothetical protein
LRGTLLRWGIARLLKHAAPERAEDATAIAAEALHHDLSGTVGQRELCQSAGPAPLRPSAFTVANFGKCPCHCFDGRHNRLRLMNVGMIAGHAVKITAVLSGFQVGVRK